MKKNVSNENLIGHFTVMDGSEGGGDLGWMEAREGVTLF